MFRVLACLLIACLAATPARSGAWPRGKGEVFLTAATRLAATRIDGPYALYSTTYLEYGLTGRLTLGADMGHGISGKAKAIAFLRVPLPLASDRHRIAAELGLGLISGEMALRPGLSYGRGFSLAQGSGWFAIDSVAEYRFATNRLDLKTDITFGLSRGNRSKTILQLQSGLSQGDPSFLRLAPSVVIRTGRRTHIEIGATAGLVGDEQVGLKLGFWREF